MTDSQTELQRGLESLSPHLAKLAKLAESTRKLHVDAMDVFMDAWHEEQESRKSSAKTACEMEGSTDEPNRMENAPADNTDEDRPGPSMHDRIVECVRDNPDNGPRWIASKLGTRREAVASVVDASCVLERGKLGVVQIKGTR